MQDPVDISRDVNVVTYIVVDELESRISSMTGDVCHIACHQIIHSHHFVTFIEQPIRKMTADESRPACQQNTHFCQCFDKAA